MLVYRVAAVVWKAMRTEERTMSIVPTKMEALNPAAEANACANGRDKDFSGNKICRLELP